MLIMKKLISSLLVEEEISEIEGVLLEKLIDEWEFKKLLKEFCANAESFIQKIKMQQVC